MPSQPPQILSYSPASERPSGGQVLLRTFLFLLGTAGGAAGMLFLGVFLWGVSGYDLRHSPTPPPIWPAVVFFALVLAMFYACVRVFRRNPRTAKWLLMGMFIAAGFASLAEGICFLNL